MERLLLLDIAGVAPRNDAYLMSFLGCIGTLMKVSCMDMLLIVAFGGVADIITVKWTNALRACHLIRTVLLQDVFQSGTKTYQELREYKEAVREHPFERLWVYCLIKPSLLALQLLHAHGDCYFLLHMSLFISTFKADFFPLP